MPKQVKVEAFVLKKRSLPSKDNIITLLTQEHGKLPVFAKGVKTITSKRLPHLQTGNLIQATLSKSTDRFYLQETSLISAFSEIKKDPHKLSFMYLLFFVVDRLFPEAQKEEKEYEEIKRFIILIANKNHHASISDIENVLNKILLLLGYIDDEKEKLDIERIKRVVEGLIDEKLPFFVI